MKIYYVDEDLDLLYEARKQNRTDQKNNNNSNNNNKTEILDPIQKGAS